jgi:hypothetical protein
LEDNIAPWWLENVAPENRNQHSEDLQKAKEIVLDTIQLLDTGL